jgi:3-hydroxyacyl-CoA dehydrogenase
MGNINSSVDLRREAASAEAGAGIAIIMVDNPPVNALKHEVRAGLAEALRKVRDDPFVEGVVVACAGRTFFAGADITEFGKPPQPPSLGEVIAQIEAMPKPVIAALHGTALGGGFEVALACHFRVATPTARVGLPEVKLGLLPGAGGTQRLPRLVGPEKALRMIVTGEPIGATEAANDGVIDEIAKGDLSARAIAFARRVIAEKRPLQKVRDRDDKLAPARADAKAFDETAAALTRRLRGRDAPAACVEAVRNAFTLPFEEGLRREGELFRKLVAGDQSKAQRHIFFAEREAAKVPNLPAATRPRPIAHAAVLGSGTMGGGIAMCFANAGVPVTVIETGHDLLQKGRDRITANYRATMARGGLSAEEMERRLGLITGAVGLDAAAEADVVIEAVFEEWLSRKRCLPNSIGSPSPGRCSRPIPRRSMSTRSPARLRGRRMSSERISSARLMSCGCWRSSAGQKALPTRSSPHLTSLGSSARCRWRSACAMALLAIGCWRGAQLRPSGCCSKERYLRKLRPRSSNLACRWVRTR